VVVVAVLVVVKVTGGRSTDPPARGTAEGIAEAATNPPVDASDLAAYTAVPTATLAAAAAHFRAPGASWPTVTSDPPLARTKPELLYLGAEWCPFCAAQRWALVLALSRFGTFSTLHSTESSSSDSYPDTPTWSFYGSTYTSPYLTFVAVEEADRDRHPLQVPTAAEAAVAARYDPAGDIPFVDFNGRARFTGAEYDPGLLAGRTFAQALAAIAAGTSTLARSVDSDAGALVSDICRMTGARPAPVCTMFPRPVTG
jgi:hypothetical protein